MVGIMHAINKKKISTVTILLLQIFAIASFFLFFFNSEFIFVFKNFADKIPMEANLESIIYRALLPFKFISNSPSLCAILFLLINLFGVIYNRSEIIGHNYAPVIFKDSDIEYPSYVAVNADNKNNIVYLQTMRLLF